MKSFIGYSTDEDIRYKATSGGVGSSLIKWMFERNIVNTAIAFDYDVKSHKYLPKLIYSFAEYTICGSIYSEIDLIDFIKSHIDKIKGTFVCFTLPCQTRTVKTIVENAGHKVIIIGLTCSSQQTIEATKYLFKRYAIKEDDILHLQYRGNGWPSGIQIELRNGKKIFIANNRSIWNKIFHSRLFIQNKCFLCQDTLNKYSDLTLADPWLQYFLQTEKIGKTLIVCNTLEGEKKLLQCVKDRAIILEEIEYSEVVKSQTGTILRKKSYRYSPVLTKIYRKILSVKMYRRIALVPIFFSIHCKLKYLFERYLLYKLRTVKRI